MEALDRELADLGPLMVEQERLEAQPPDPVFAAQLRARLVDLAGQTAPAPAPPERPRRHLVQFPRWHRMRWAGLGGAALVAAAAVLFLLLRSPEKTTTPVPSATWLPPT